MIRRRPPGCGFDDGGRGTRPRREGRVTLTLDGEELIAQPLLAITAESVAILRENKVHSPPSGTDSSSWKRRRFSSSVGKPRVIYTPCSGTTPEVELDALRSFCGFALQEHQ
jgi:hypothetical protein